MATRTTMHLHSRRCPDTVFIIRVGHGGADRDAIGGALYVCDAFAETGSCPWGATCADAHVPLHNARRLVPHVRDRASSSSCGAGAGAVRYPRYASALGHFTVAQPNAGTPSVQVRADECLVTRAIGADGRVSHGVTVLNVCAHFQRKGACDYGAECSFVHPLGTFTHVSAAAGITPHPGAAGAATSRAQLQEQEAARSSAPSPPLSPAAPCTLAMSPPATPYAAAPPMPCPWSSSLTGPALISPVGLLSHRSVGAAQSVLDHHSAAPRGGAEPSSVLASPSSKGAALAPPSIIPHHEVHHHHDHQLPRTDPVTLTLTLPPAAIFTTTATTTPTAAVAAPPPKHRRYIHDPYTRTRAPGWRSGPPSQPNGSGDTKNCLS